MPRFAGELVEEEPRPRFGGELVEEESSPEPIAGERTVAPREEQSGLDLQDVRGAGQAVLSGMTAGFADEGIGYARSALDALLPGTEADRIARQFGGEDQSFSDQASMYIDDARASAEEFAEENPGTALGLEIGGAILSPLNRVAPGLGTQGGTLSRLGGSVARASGEGALYGLGQAEGSLEERLENAAEGAKFGGGTALALTGGGGLLGRALSKSRVGERLRDAAGNFKPLHLADPEGTVGQLYRSVVGGSYGGRGALGRQESQYLNRAAKLARFADEGADLVEESVGTASEVRRLKDSIDNARRTAADSAKAAARQVDADEALETSRYALQRSVPEGFEDAVTEVGTEGVQQAGSAINRAYNSAWADAVANPVVLGNVRTVFGDVSAELSKKERAAITRIMSELNDGKSLQLIDRELRELLSGKSSNAMSRAIRDMRSTLRAGLPVERQALLEATDAVYPNYLASLRASTSAGAQSRGGVFNAKELSSAAKAAQGWRQAGQGAVDLFEYARPVLRRTKAAQDAIKRRNMRAGQVARASKNRLDEATKGILPETNTAWSQAAATALLGSPFALVGGLGALPAGAALARGLASPRVQEAIAGQLPVQEALAKALREGDMAKYQRIMSRITAQQATGG